MENSYHHGNLRIELIEVGLSLIHDEGLSNFSLRKLAKKIGVSATACYNHFANSEALLYEMKKYVTQKFCDALTDGIDYQTECCSINMGKSYVDFFAKNPHYFSFIYENNDYNIVLSNDSFEGDFEPFLIFKDTAIQSMEHNHIEKEKFNENLIVMWATVHGLAAMANMKGFHYEGDWGTLTKKILDTKINLF